MDLRDQQTERDIARAVGALGRWGPSEVNAAFRGLQRRRADGARGRLVRRAALVGALAAAGFAVFGAFHGLQRGSPPAARLAEHEASTPDTLTLADGDEVTPLAPSSEVRVLENTAGRTVVALPSGVARFHIRHDPRRVFWVQAGAVQIEDLGTTFEVRHLGAARVRVSVTEGRVAVSYPGPGGTTRRLSLAGGQDRAFPDDPQPPSPESPLPPAAEPRPGGPPDASRAGPRAESWRALAQGGQYTRAFGALSRSGFRDIRDDSADLLLAADVARLSYHAGAAVEPLQRLLARHPDDPRAPAAAFTLGWILMNDLRRPREAALTFATAEATAPRGNLAEDAAARCAEAWYQSGDLKRANEEVRRYLRAYPAGRYRALLERLIEGR